MGLSREEFQRLSVFINTELGIKMPENKQVMLSGRISKRLKALALPSFAAYCEYFFSSAGQESETIHLIDAVTTNKTDFFREPSHFEYLTQTALPELKSCGYVSGIKGFNIWSAGCSTGEEPYTMAMVLDEYRQEHAGFNYGILATDISSRVLETARRAVYPLGHIDPIPQRVRKKYLLKNKNKRDPLVRIVPGLRSRVTFGRLNFMDENFGLQKKMHVVFCRNVMIYFDRETKEHLIEKFCRHLHAGGYVFVGHSESLHGYDIPLDQVAPTIYRKIP